MNFSLAFTNLILGASLAFAKTNDPADLVRDRLEMNLHLNGMGAEHDQERHLSTLNTDFSYFLGEWYDCLHTTMMTFNGDTASKHVLDQVGCDGGLFGDVTKVGTGDQTLSFDIFLLNHCWFHDLGAPGQDPCPNDLLENDSRGDGNILVKYSFKGIGSFADSDRIEFHSDHSSLRDPDTGAWQPNLERAKLENMDTLVCEKHHGGIVCDWRINEYRTATNLVEEGCKKGKNNCKPEWNKKKCDKKGGEWTDECSRTEYTPNGFVYDSFGSYYLVKDNSQCNVQCSTANPSSTLAPETKVSGCYTGGLCNGAHGCCDCTMTEETCNAIWTDGCRPICFD